MPSSFRDPAGYVIRERGMVKRIVTRRGGRDYDLYVSSGLHSSLLDGGYVLPHQEERPPATADAYKVLVPEQIEYVSYPYEWSFDQLKDAALLTLEIQETALRHGLSLKDASAFNVQFRGAFPVFIDCLSFEEDRGGPWIAYEQFCRHFLAPLLLMKYRSPWMVRFSIADLSGLPLDLISRLLPFRSKFNLDALFHIHLHAREQRRQARSPKPRKGAARELKRTLVRSLRDAVQRLSAPAVQSCWSSYYDKQRHYSHEAEDFKASAVRHVAARLGARLVYDLGANTGRYSADAASAGAYCVAFDSDPASVNRMYLAAKQKGDRRVLPLFMDLLNPTPGVGLDLTERLSFPDRGCADLTLALALIHHLRITGQAPLSRLAAFFSRFSQSLLIEFVPKSDPMAAQMLTGREDTFDDLTRDGFLAAFDRHFSLEYKVEVPGTSRLLCVLKNTQTSAGIAA